MLASTVAAACRHPSPQRPPSPIAIPDALDATPARVNTALHEYIDGCQPRGCCGGSPICRLVPIECSTLVRIVSETALEPPTMFERETGAFVSAHSPEATVVVRFDASDAPVRSMTRLNPPLARLDAVLADGADLVAIGARPRCEACRERDAWWIRCEGASCAQRRHERVTPLPTRPSVREPISANVLRRVDELVAQQERVAHEQWCLQSSSGCLGELSHSAEVASVDAGDGSPSPQAPRVVSRGALVGLAAPGVPDSDAVTVYESREEEGVGFRLDGFGALEGGGLALLAGYRNRWTRRDLAMLVRFDTAGRPVGQPVRFAEGDGVAWLQCPSATRCLAARVEVASGRAGLHVFLLALPPVERFEASQPPGPWTGPCRI